jgi:hypothetical protein
MKHGWDMRALAAAIGITLMICAACDKKDEETDETSDETADEEEEPKAEASAAASGSASADSKDETPPPVKTTRRPPPVRVGACTAQGQCNGGLCCSTGAKTFCAGLNKGCGGARVVCSRDSQCGKQACIPEATLPGVKTCQKKTAAKPAPKPAPKPTGDIAPFGRPGNFGPRPKKK